MEVEFQDLHFQRAKFIIRMEMITFLHGLKLVTEKNLIPIIVETDSQILIHMLTENTQIFSHSLSLIKDLNEPQINHVYREVNVVANKLVVLARRHLAVFRRQQNQRVGNNVLTFDFSPHFILHDLLEDFQSNETTRLVPCL